jgi:hypothetical protein
MLQFVLSGCICALLLILGSATSAQQRCYFLECTPGTTTVPAPAPPTQANPQPPRPSSQAQEPRPGSPGEACISRTGLTYCASSSLAPQFGFSYLPGNLIDGRLDTAWVEGDVGDGLGEWIVVQFSGPRLLSQLRVWNGYHKNIDIFRKNNRVRDAEIVLSNGYRQTTTLSDRDGPQNIEIDSPNRSEWVQLIVKSVYRGTKYRDTAISELRLVFSD